VGLRDKVKRLERASREEFFEIPQKDGTVARFPKSEGIVAYINWFDRMGAGEDAPPEHPLITAIRNTSDPYWRNTFWLACEDPDEWVKPIPDLSE
jgi:hypothetical protein